MIFFRAENIGHSLQYISKIFSHPGSFFLLGVYLQYQTILILVAIFFIIEWIGREGQYAIAHFGAKWYKPLRWALYCLIIFSIFYFTGKEQQFIYFQF